MSTTVDDTKVTLLTFNAPGATKRTQYHNIIRYVVAYSYLLCILALVQLQVIAAAGVQHVKVMIENTGQV